MIGLQDARGIYYLPTDWAEVTTAQYCWLLSLAHPSHEAIASYFAGRPIQVSQHVAEAQAWRFTEPPTDQGLPFPQDLGQESFLQVELLREAFTGFPLSTSFVTLYGLMVQRQHSCYGRGVFKAEQAHFIAQQCAAWPVTETYPAVKHCLNELARLSEKYSKLATPCGCDDCLDAEAAGIGRMQGFKHYNTLTAYAQHFGLSIAQAEQVPYDTVALHLLHERMQHEFQVDLRRQSQQRTDQ